MVAAGEGGRTSSPNGVHCSSYDVHYRGVQLDSPMVAAIEGYSFTPQCL